MSNPLTPTTGLAELLYGLARSNQPTVPTNSSFLLTPPLSPPSDSSFLRQQFAASILGGPAPVPARWRWFYVTRRFGQLLGNLKITGTQQKDGETKQAGVRACLNRHYWGHNSPSLNSMLIGSWGKGTKIGPPRDIDILYLLPSDVYWRFQGRSGNRQSDLLQEVKEVLVATYPQTAMRGDGQVVVIPFNTTPIEVCPGFTCTDGILLCETLAPGAISKDLPPGAIPFV